MSASTPTEEARPRSERGRRGRPATGSSKAGRVARADRDGANAITEDHRSSHSRALTSQQLAAVELIITGRTDKEVAAKTGVARETVSRWRHQNPLFIAEVNRRRLDVWKAKRERLSHLGARALDVLEQKLQAGDVRVALAFLNHVEAEKVPSGGITIEEVVEDIIEDHNLALLLRKLRAKEDSPLARVLRQRWLDEEQPPTSPR